MKFTCGKLIRKRRLELGMYQVTLSKKLKVTSQYVANWERGAANPSPKYINKIAKILKMDKWALVECMAVDYMNELKRRIKC